MIIVKQNKDIVNFSRVSEIKIVDYEAQKKSLKNNLGDIFVSALIANVEIDGTKLSGYGIYAYFEKDNWSVLGEYKTEERAKEVLQEIVKATIENKKAEEAKDMFGFSIIPADTYYEMPED